METLDTIDDIAIKSIPIKHGKLLGKSGHKCPICDKNLDLYKSYGITIETCPTCHGLWLTKGELKVLKNNADEDDGGNLRWMNDEIAVIGKTSAVTSIKACPECQDKYLLSTHFGNSGIMIAWCKKCHGTWLDSKELEAIILYLKDELNHLSSKEVEEKAIQSVKRIWQDNSENKVSEILDAKAAISALVNISIFEHPAIFKLLTATTEVAESVGLV